MWCQAKSETPVQTIMNPPLFFSSLTLLACTIVLTFSPATANADEPANAPDSAAVIARAFATSQQTITIWPEGKVPGKVATEPEAIRSPERTDAIRITNVSNPTLTFYPADSVDGPTPVAIVCPGGGYSYVVIDKEGTEPAQWLNKLGISALVLKYRNPSNRDGALQDLQRSIRIARDRVEEWNVDPEQIGILGFSAGGNLCAKGSTQFDKATYKPIDAIDKVSCRPDFAMLVYPAYLDHNGKVSEDLNLSANIPPTLIVHNKDDERFVVGSQLYAKALHSVGHPSKFLYYQTGGHGYGLRCEGEAKAWPSDAEQWLRANGIVADDK